MIKVPNYGLPGYLIEITQFDIPTVLEYKVPTLWTLKDAGKLAVEVLNALSPRYGSATISYIGYNDSNDPILFKLGLRKVMVIGIHERSIFIKSQFGIPKIKLEDLIVKSSRY